MPLLDETISGGQTGHITDTQQVHGKLNDFPNVVRDYGADPTGATDSSSAWQTAIGETSASGSPLVGPTGIYDIGTTLDLSSRSAIHIIGSGTAMHNESGGYGTVLRSRTNGMTVMKFDTGALVASGPTIEGVNFRAKTGHTGVTCLSLKRVNRWRVDRCGFRSEDADQNTGMVADGAADDNAWWTIDQPMFSNFRTGLSVINGFGGWVIGGQFIAVASSTTAVGVSASGVSSLKMFAPFFDQGVPIVMTDSSYCSLYGAKIELWTSGQYACDLVGACTENTLDLVLGGNGSVHNGLRFSATANGNHYVVKTENMGSGAFITDAGTGNTGDIWNKVYAYRRMQHIGSDTPTGGLTGDMLVGNSKIWVKDGATWKSVTVA